LLHRAESSRQTLGFLAFMIFGWFPWPSVVLIKTIAKLMPRDNILTNFSRILI